MNREILSSLKSDSYRLNSSAKVDVLKCLITYFYNIVDEDILFRIIKRLKGEAQCFYKIFEDEIGYSFDRLFSDWSNLTLSSEYKGGEG